MVILIYYDADTNYVINMMNYKNCEMMDYIDWIGTTVSDEVTSDILMSENMGTYDFLLAQLGIYHQELKNRANECWEEIKFYDDGLDIVNVSPEELKLNSKCLLEDWRTLYDLDAHYTELEVGLLNEFPELKELYKE